ncbi:hypothetical protein M406DRAFT_328708 [Cryphonectria parasitica EP155]|uniref:Uncharacterized protein n=1 Tax=Cryphonectria parasitica (strain ATCC 38755 / EP155) TaxID=660469 RepID=A0A9P4Y6J1_CRYP1|nr:uncharacterized protein M406DRAFT_328708 [Cryphonectria parasitica EP155]KAF3767638.1 hypothetical protein M406DRAFT_328708 [Cryphonectria parasitica EP155]
MSIERRNGQASVLPRYHLFKPRRRHRLHPNIQTFSTRVTDECPTRYFSSIDEPICWGKCAAEAKKKTPMQMVSSRAAVELSLFDRFTIVTEDTVGSQIQELTDGSFIHVQYKKPDIQIESVTFLPNIIGAFVKSRPSVES